MPRPTQNTAIFYTENVTKSRKIGLTYPGMGTPASLMGIQAQRTTAATATNKTLNVLIKAILEN